MVLEIVGNADRSAATRYTLFDAAGTLATSYLAWFDGHGYDWFKEKGQAGASGLLLTDAGMNLLGVAALMVLLALVYRPRPHR